LRYRPDSRNDVHRGSVLEDVAGNAAANRPKKLIAIVFHGDQDAADGDAAILSARKLLLMKAYKLQRIENDHAARLAKLVGGTISGGQGGGNTKFRPLCKNMSNGLTQQTIAAINEDTYFLLHD
jgi:hypothetical protein